MQILLNIYKNKNDHKENAFQGPFYFKIIGKNKSSWKVQSVDENKNPIEEQYINQISSNNLINKKNNIIKF